MDDATFPKIKESLVAVIPPDQSVIFGAMALRLQKKQAAQKKRVFVAMSGGVDSSVAAALLKKQGYDVTGVFINAWSLDMARDKQLSGRISCMQQDDKREAMRAAAHLGIPFLTFNFEKEYKKDVVDYMVQEYREGRTPNPDVMCNKHIKFGVFLKKAREMGADYIATGHYARIATDPSGYTLLAGKDKNKDQSYFLWTLTQEQLRYTLFPIGDLLKPEVRELARKFGLPNAERKDSQGLCVVGEFPMKDFLKHFISEKRGDVLNEAGDIIGYHDGAFFFTLGQRHGFTVTKKKPNGPPQYIVAKDVVANTITVAPMEAGETQGVRDVLLEQVNFISGIILDIGREYQARFRYRQPLQNVRIMNYESGIKKGAIPDSRFAIRFEEPQGAVASGQSLVLYDGEECLGGGVLV